MKVKTKIAWRRAPVENFLDGSYKRTHQWIMEGGMVIHASASPEIVPIPMSDPTLLDPEEAYLSSISSCHMLFFLSIAAKKKWIIDTYEDTPIARLSKNESNKMAVMEIILQPKIVFNGLDQPKREIINRMHQIAHSNCFLANSVNTKITIK